MQFLRRDDDVLHYQVISAPDDKPAIVFVNALGTDFRIWRDVVVRLVGTFAVLTYDMRGHGLSDTGTTPYTMADHAADLAALMDHEGISNAFICGLSVGGQVAQQLYADRPDLVRGLILCDTAGKIGDAESWDARVETIRQEGIAGIAEGALGRWFTETFRSEHPDACRGYHNMLVRQDPEGYIATCAALKAFDGRETAKQIAVPSICIVGDSDGSTPPSQVADFAKTIPGAHLEVVKRAGHIPSVEQPEDLTAMITAFADLVIKGG